MALLENGISYEILVQTETKLNFLKFTRGNKLKTAATHPSLATVLTSQQTKVDCGENPCFEVIYTAIKI